MQAKCISTFGNLGKSQYLAVFVAGALRITNIQGEYFLVLTDILWKKHFIAGKGFLSNTDFGLESN